MAKDMGGYTQFINMKYILIINYAFNPIYEAKKCQKLEFMKGRLSHRGTKSDHSLIVRFKLLREDTSK